MFVSPFGILGLLVAVSGRLGIDAQGLITGIILLCISAWFFSGFAQVPSQEFVAATIPVQYRGRYIGYAFTFGSMAGIIMALLATRVLATMPKPASFGIVLLMGYAICKLGCFGALFAKELPTPVENARPSPGRRRCSALRGRTSHFAIGWGSTPLFSCLCSPFSLLSMSTASRSWEWPRLQLGCSCLSSR